MSIELTGEIQVIFGPMFSGKTTELIRRIKRRAIAKSRCLLIKYAKDTRYDNECMATHDNVTMAAVSVNRVMEAWDTARTYSVIGIDEGQFFEDIVPFCEQLANIGKTVIVAALDGNFLRQPFNDILHLVPLAESVTKLTAVCMLCYGSASYTKRIGTETQLEVIGGCDKYIAACRKCHSKKVERRPEDNALTDCSSKSNMITPNNNNAVLSFNSEEKENAVPNCLKSKP